MRKKIVVILVVLVMMFGVLAGCGDNYPQFDVKETPDKSYAVTSNGGMAVQYGDFVYFINGYKAIADTNGKNNVWGDVVKGGIYYAKLSDGKSVDTKDDFYGSYKTYDNSNNNEFNDDFSGFVTQKKTYKDGNEEEKEIDQIAVNPVVPKLVTNGGYLNGGLFIIDDFIYYTSPTTLKDKKGNIQYNLVDFYRTKVDGKHTQFLYRSKSTSTKPVFGYYKVADSVYVVVYEASQQKIYSIRVTAKKVYDEKVIADEVTSAILPQKDVYYAGMSDNLPEDYIYFTRGIDRNFDIETKGNIVERVRPDGTQKFKILSGTQITLDKVFKGHLFFFTQDSITKGYYAKNLVNFNEQDSEQRVQPVKIFEEDVANAPASVYGIPYSSDFVALAVNTSSTLRYESTQTTSHQILGSKTKLLRVAGNDVYYIEDTTTEESTEAVGRLYKMNYFTGVNEAITENNIKADFLNIDMAGGYVFYISSISELAESIKNDKDELVPVLAQTTNYLKVQNLTSSTKTEWDLGKLDKADYPPVK